jgi:hypothetical protein
VVVPALLWLEPDGDLIYILKNMIEDLLIWYLGAKII